MVHKAASMLLLLASLLRPLSSKEPEVTRETWVMGTRLRISVEAMYDMPSPDESSPIPGKAPASSSLPGAAKLAETAILEVEAMDGILSTWDSTSEMSRANHAPAGEPVSISPQLASLLQEALDWSQRTLGAFDPTVGALVDAWDLRSGGVRQIPWDEDNPLPVDLVISSRGSEADPSRKSEADLSRGRKAGPTWKELIRARAASGPKQFELLLAGGTDADDSQRAFPAITRRSPRAWIDTGAFGKGSALRAAAGAMKALGTRGLLDLGGQIWAWGSASEPWLVSVAHPLHRRRGIVALVVQNVSVATSGTSERWTEVESERLGHILDPRSGRPAPAWGSVTVVSPDPMAADILSTALYVMGPDDGMTWVQNHPEIGVFFLEICGEGVRATWNHAMEPWFLEVPGNGRRGDSPLFPIEGERGPICP